MDLEKKLLEEFRENCAKAKLFGCNQDRFLAQAEKIGAVKVMKDLIRRNRVSDGFDLLSKARHLELSPEATMVKNCYGTLFTDDEIDACFAVLCEEQYYG